MALSPFPHPCSLSTMSLEALYSLQHILLSRDIILLWSQLRRLGLFKAGKTGLTVGEKAALISTVFTLQNQDDRQGSLRSTFSS